MPKKSTNQKAAGGGSVILMCKLLWKHCGRSYSSMFLFLLFKVLILQIQVVNMWNISLSNHQQIFSILPKLKSQIIVFHSGMAVLHLL